MLRLFVCMDCEIHCLCVLFNTRLMFTVLFYTHRSLHSFIVNVIPWDLVGGHLTLIYVPLISRFFSVFNCI